MLEKFVNEKLKTITFKKLVSAIRKQNEVIPFPDSGSKLKEDENGPIKLPIINVMKDLKEDQNLKDAIIISSNSERTENIVENVQECGICLQQFEDGEQLKALDCAKKLKEQNKDKDLESIDKKCDGNMMHIFHEVCIVKWFEKKTECPLCRASYDAQINEMVANNIQ